jgi:hypothetical protein
MNDKLKLAVHFIIISITLLAVSVIRIDGRSPPVSQNIWQLKLRHTVTETKASTRPLDHTFFEHTLSLALLAKVKP